MSMRYQHQQQFKELHSPFDSVCQHLSTLCRVTVLSFVIAPLSLPFHLQIFTFYLAVLKLHWQALHVYYKITAL